MKKITDKFRSRRTAAGAVYINLPEVKIRVDGDDIHITPLPELASREMVTEAMLMAGSRAAPTMRGPKCLVKVDVHDVDTGISGAELSQNGIEVCTIIVDEGVMLVCDFGNLGNVAIENAKGIGVCQHNGRGLVCDHLGQHVDVEHAGLAVRGNGASRVAGDGDAAGGTVPVE